MGEGIQRLGAMEEWLGRDRLAEALRGKVREMILALAEAELGRGIWGPGVMSGAKVVVGIATASG